MLENLKEEVFKANLMLPEYNLVKFTWGNVSVVDRETNSVIIKPSGVSYKDMKKEDMVVVDLFSGKIIDGNLNPSSDTETHLEILRNFKDVNSVVHTHSPWATIFAQSQRGIMALGTTHGDYFYGEIPCTRLMTPEEIKNDYEKNTGKVIVETFENINPLEIPAVLVASHGVFAWGTSPENAVHNAVIVEEIAFMVWHNLMLDKNIKPMQQELLDKHYLRKHGKDAYYGQS